MQRIIALSPYNITVAFNEVIIDDIPYWFTDDELATAKNRKLSYRKDKEPEPLEPWVFNPDQ